jgi:hypothetical protein
VPRVGRNGAGDLVDQRGLAGAIRADQRVDFAGQYFKADIIRHRKPAIMLAQTLDAEQRLSHGAPPENQSTRRA